MHNSIFEPTTKFFYQCGNNCNINDQSNLCKAKKKRITAKFYIEKNALEIKIFELNDVDSMNNRSKNKLGNIFDHNFSILNQKSTIKITFEDTIFISIK